MTEIRAERYEIGQARSGDKLEKITEGKELKRERGKTSFIKYEQKQTHFNRSRKLLEQGQLQCHSQKQHGPFLLRIPARKDTCPGKNKAFKIHQLSFENLRLLCRVVSEGTFYTLPLSDHSHFLVAVKAELAVYLRCMRKNLNLGQQVLLLIKYLQMCLRY